MKYYAEEIQALEERIARAQAAPQSYDLRSGSRPRNLLQQAGRTARINPPSPERRQDNSSVRRKQNLARKGVSEYEVEGATTSNSKPRTSRKGQEFQEDRGHVSMGLFEDVDPDDLDEDEVIWGEKSMLMSTPYGDWPHGGPGQTIPDLQRKKITARKSSDASRRPDSPEGLAGWMEAARLNQQESQRKTGEHFRV